MHTEIRVLERIGLLLTYPRGDYGDRLESCRTALPRGDVEADALVGSFVRQFQNLPIEKLQELYTHTFDLNPVCEVGWQLHGEEYGRGAFLVAMRNQLRRHGIPESRELPDHLSNVLSLLDRMAPEEARNFTETFLLPALNKMLTGFPDQNNPYRNVLLVIAKLLSSNPGEGLAEAPRV